MSDSATSSTADPAAPRWRALERNERRVAGVLAEKAKTTPENYPLSLNALINGCNQKSNRFPQMQLDEAQVSDALDTLRRAGAVALIQGDGRVEKFRHLLYDWLGVDKAELAVMTELLLRGAQTLGELRGRAARMEPIRDIGELQPVVDRLRHKGLIIFLSAAGRGAVVTHNLYQRQELAKLRSEQGAGDSAETASPAALGSAGESRTSPPPSRSEPSPASVTEPAGPHDLREQVSALKRELAELREETEAAAREMRSDLEDLHRQLGG